MHEYVWYVSFIAMLVLTQQKQFEHVWIYTIRFTREMRHRDSTLYQLDNFRCTRKNGSIQSVNSFKNTIQLSIKLRYLWDRSIYSKDVIKTFLCTITKWIFHGYGKAYSWLRWMYKWLMREMWTDYGREYVELFF